MKYLLDVSALIALGFAQHNFHRKIVAWLQGQASPNLATCSIAELGFVRILSQQSGYALTVDQASELLTAVKSSSRWPVEFLADDQEIANLPVWVKSPAQTTDGHLVQLAKAHGCVLATFDARIPEAHLIS